MRNCCPGTWLAPCPLPLSRPPSRQHKSPLKISGDLFSIHCLQSACRNHAAQDALLGRLPSGNAFRIAPTEIPSPQSENPRRLSATGVFWCNSLTMTYFHTGCSTIIGAKSFHGPVRDGKGWYQLAMVIRHDLSVLWRAAGCMSHAAGVSDNPNWKK